VSVNAGAAFPAPPSPPCAISWQNISNIKLPIAIYEDLFIFYSLLAIFLIDDCFSIANAAALIKIPHLPIFSLAFFF
jgi:hypothetical protein